MSMFECIFVGFFWSFNGPWHGSRSISTSAPFYLKKQIFTGGTVPGISQILRLKLQVSHEDHWLLSIQISLGAFPTIAPPLCISSLSFCFIFFSGVMFLAEGQQQVGLLVLHRTNMAYHDPGVLQRLATETYIVKWKLFYIDIFSKFPLLYCEYVHKLAIALLPLDDSKSWSHWKWLGAGHNT